jgi:hypothetical protein
MAHDNSDKDHTQFPSHGDEDDESNSQVGDHADMGNDSQSGVARASEIAGSPAGEVTSEGLRKC